MKKITAIVRAEKLEVLKDALLVNTIPKVQFTLICADEHVDGIVDIICNAARTGAVGDGKIWVEPVEEVIRIRTGEHGPSAV